MNQDKTPALKPEDFAEALKELGSYTDVSVDTLMDIQHSANKYARLRNTQNIAVARVMTHPVITVHRDQPLSKAAQMLVEQRISGLPVVDDQNTLTGIITEADFLRALGLPAHHPGHSLWQTLEDLFYHDIPVQEPHGSVADLMMANVYTVSPDQTLHEALQVMKHNRIKRLVVTDPQKQVVGMITRSNLLQLFFEHFKPIEEIQQGD